MSNALARYTLRTRYRKICRARAFAVFMALGAAILTGCGGDSSGPSVSSVQITATHASIAKGTSTQLTATAVYADNTHADVTDDMTWTSSNKAVATVSSSGKVSTVGAGTATISGICATPSVCGSVTSNFTVTVTPATLASIALTPPIPSIAAGTSQQITATGTFSDNTTQNVSSDVTWTSSNTSLATVSSSGLVSTVGAGTGTATITATCNVASVCSNLSGSATLTVTAATLASITLSASSSSIAVGATEQLTGTGNFSDNATQNLSTDLTWTSSNTSVATVSSSGLVSAVGAGTATITAACKVASVCGSVTGTTTVTVPAAVTLVSIAVTPATPSIALGTSESFTATGTYSDNSTQNLTTQVTWTSATTSVATISNASGSAGVAHPVAAGTTHITAALGSITSPAVTLTVTQASLVSIAVTPTTTSAAATTTKQFVATGTYSDQSTHVLTTAVTWTSSNTSVATISNAGGSWGLATGLSIGSSSIAATLNGITSATATLNVTAAPQAATMLYSFAGGTADGAHPYAPLIQASDGSFYGTTYAGGANSGAGMGGIVFHLTLSGTSWTETPLHSFGGTGDGFGPSGGLILAQDGNLYGTTAGLSPPDYGKVFKLTTAGTETLFHSFNGSDGGAPVGILIQDSSGNFYGVSSEGGANGAYGTLFKITANGTYTLLHSFGAGSDGQDPAAGLTFGSDGNLYGTTSGGGANGHGTVFEYNLTQGTETVLYSFGATGTDGTGPQSTLIQDSAGNFYGTTFQGGAHGAGTVFKLTPQLAESILYSFGATGDGRDPYSGMIVGNDGNFYGTTYGGGANGEGTIYEISPAGVETVLYSFGNNSGDGTFPQAPLIQGADGHFYGTTVVGGANGYGAVFKY